MRLASFLLAAAALAAPAAARTPVNVPAFDAIQLRGGGDVVVRHGPVQRVTFTATHPNLVAFAVERGTLVMRPCRRSCRDQDFRVEIVTPRLGAAAIQGGGAIRFASGVPAGGNLALSILGGGRIDAARSDARSVAASIKGGGIIRTGEARSLAVSILGGGSVRYCGDPAKTVSINGGGTVSKSCAR